MLLAVIGVGVFLAGLELLVTAVALPSILADLADPTGGSAWIELRKASWIINGYLLVYILTMPIAGRLADLWGARRLFIGALAVFTVGSALAGASQTLDQLIAARLVQAVGGGVLVPVGTAAAVAPVRRAARPRALGVVGALTFLGMAAGPVVGAAILASVHPDGALAAAGVTGTAAAAILEPAWRWVFYINIPIGIIAIVLALGGLRGLGDAATAPGRVDIVGAALFGVALVAGLHRPDAARLDGDRRDGRAAGGRDGCAARRRGGRDCGGRGRARAAGPRPVPRPAAVPERAVQLGRARLAADRATRSRPRSSAGRCSSIASCTAARTTSGWHSAHWRGATAVGALASGFVVRVVPLAAGRVGRDRAQHRRTRC